MLLSLVTSTACAISLMSWVIVCHVWMNLAEFHFINIVKWLTVGKLVLQVTQLIIWLPSLYLMSQFYIW